MKRNSIIIFVFAYIAAINIISSCQHTFDCGSESKVSTVTGKSHNAGQDCLSCHAPGGRGDGCFAIGGTAYDAAGNIASGAIIQFYSAANGGGILKASVPVNSSGSFYMSQSMATYYPAIVSKAGTKTFMSTPLGVGGGGCALCHGKTTNTIVAN